MIINYKFDGNDFEYEITIDRFFVAMHNILCKENKEDLIEFILDAHGCSVDLKNSFEEELKEYFYDRAYKEYRDWRYE